MKRGEPMTDNEYHPIDQLNVKLPFSQTPCL